ncbi:MULTISPECIES: hypothetical protein [Parachlamydia]|jgi:hypothetical protein|uniref:hypothetical protein n=1 Tax=Parachlamydia TaxID=83551 RepID=UPI0001C17790|nr:hypothetical protein [Parachlamydia acanthamoebae]EFB40599.1 hypothetical protein pah_c198o012 [Parachlamydia acanthamoebae str. Hall's coccus]
MDISHFLARLLGVMLVVIYGSYFFNRAFYRRLWQDVLDHPAIIILSGFITLLCGLLVVLSHDIWIPDWRGLITFLGWLMVFAGIARLVFPAQVAQFGQNLIKKDGSFLDIISGIMFLIGLYLLYVSF